MLWLFLFKIYFKKESKDYNINNDHPTQEIYKYLSMIISFYSFYSFIQDKHAIGSTIFWYFLASFVISYNVMDLTFYRHGETNIVWPIHHLFVIMLSAPLMALNTCYHQFAATFFLYEFGSFFFMLQWKVQNNWLNAVFVVIYIATRCWIGHILCTIHYTITMESSQLQNNDYFWNLEWAIMNVAVLILNGYFAFKSIKRICRKCCCRRSV